MNIGGFHALSAAWLALLLGPLVLFYFLKLKRPRIEIPSLVLWKQALQDVRVNSPFQRFKRNLLLLLQILLLLLIVLAAMQPFWRGRATRMRRLPVLIDTSASMAAVDRAGGPSRLTEARRKAAELIDGLGSDQEVCLITFGQHARKRIGFTGNQRLLREALAGIEAERVPSDVEEAMRLVQSLARGEPFDEVILLSDGNLPARAHFDLSFRLSWQRLPPAGPNLGLTALSARRAAGGTWDVFVQMEGSGDAEGVATLALIEEGQELASQRVTFARGRGQRAAFRVPGDRPARLRARLTPDGFDSLAEDDEAAIELPALRPLDLYVPRSRAAFRTALRGIHGVRVHPEDGVEPPPEFDLAIAATDEDLAKKTRVRLLAGLVPPELRTLVSVGSNGTQVVDWRRDAPLLQHAVLSDLVIVDQPRTAEGVSESDFESLGYEVLAHGHRGPLILEKREGEVYEAVLLFDPDRSTLPYRVAFPILVANLVQTAMERGGLAEAHGQDGLLSTAETSLTAVDAMEFNERLTVSVAETPLKTDRELWRALAFAGLAVLLAEWWWFQRRPG